MTTPRWQSILIQCKREPRFIQILLALLRVCICFLPQTGYLHPDEFFQSTDIIAGSYFNSKVQPAWEFKAEKPIRCMLIPNVINYIAFSFVELIQGKQPSPYLLLVAPRLAYTLFSFIIDFCLFKLCQYYSSRGLWYQPVSIIFQSSFVCLACLTRTLSNVPEVIIFALLLVIVAQTIRPRFRILFVGPSGRSTPVNQRVKASTQITSSVLVGFLVTLGTFNRPTFPCFALVPAIYWTLESVKRNSYSVNLTLQRIVIPSALTSLLTATTISAYDTANYNGIESLKRVIHLLVNLNILEFYNELCSSWILTPYNFITFNSNVNNLSRFGLHLPYTHFLVNIPLAFNILGFIFYGKILSLLFGSGAYRLIFSSQRIHGLMLMSALTSTILMSFIPHQEFRFLLPLIVPLAYVFAFRIYASNKLLSIWLILNLILIYFYSSVHQSAVIRSCMDLNPILKSYLREERDLLQVNVVAYRCYMVPSYLWNIPKHDFRFNLDLNEPEEDLSAKLARVITRQRDNPLYTHKFYIMLPRLYIQELVNTLQSNFSIESHKLNSLKNYTHFSGEDFQNSIHHVRKFGLGMWKQAFGFALLQVDLYT